MTQRNKEIIKLYKLGYTYQSIAALYSLGKSTVADIVKKGINGQLTEIKRSRAIKKANLRLEKYMSDRKI